jgi:hypothetical protein
LRLRHCIFAGRSLAAQHEQAVSAARDFVSADTEAVAAAVSLASRRFSCAGNWYVLTTVWTKLAAGSVIRRWLTRTLQKKNGEHCPPRKSRKAREGRRPIHPC